MKASGKMIGKKPAKKEEIDRQIRSFGG